MEGLSFILWMYNPFLVASPTPKDFRLPLSTSGETEPEEPSWFCVQRTETVLGQF